ncbi:CPBP family intramembrane glutamic endopeptidase [Longimicrobium sp.]|uniref:CPBP family intramembrane glutamic endopeptidase n=1 Tax=Longimicrobium sp. TaxID=2029185 RepID=UPI003B3ACB43
MKPDPRSTLSYRIGSSVAALASGLLTWLVWYIPLALLFQLSPAMAIVGMVALTALFLRVYALPGRWSARARARSRVRRMGPAWPWVLLTAPAMAALSLGMWTALLALGMAQETEFAQELTRFLERPGGEVAFYILAVLLAPLMEEFGFRGWIQRPLEKRWGAQPAIAVTAVLFALAHLEPQAVPVRLAAGLVLGHAVYATRSIWTGVALHVAWNAGVLAFGTVLPDFDPTGKGWRWAAPAAAVAVVSLLWCAWTVRRMQDETGRARPEGGTAARSRPVQSSS